MEIDSLSVSVRFASEIMQSRLPSLRAVVFLAALVSIGVTLAAHAAWAQDDPSSLGDVARDLRKNKSQQRTEQPNPVPTVIDNDNLVQVMEDAKSARPIKSEKTVFSVDPSGNTLKVSSPDVTCSLSFNARSSSLIKSAPIEELPLTELLKIDGPGSIQDESLQLQVFNGTDWDIKEITV